MNDGGTRLLNMSEQNRPTAGQHRCEGYTAISPFQQVNSSASEHHRIFERIAITWPS
jgi:hypothetical protein